MVQYFLFCFICPVNILPVQWPDFSIPHRHIEQAASDLTFGERQVEQFINDRPGTGAIINNEPVLRMMLIWKFAGELTGNRVYWDACEPSGPARAQHSPSGFGKPVKVRVSNTPRGSADKCVMLLFELLNSNADKEYQALANADAKHRKSPDEFAKSVVVSEFIALKQTKYFFVVHPIRKSGENDENYRRLTTLRCEACDYLNWLKPRDKNEANPLRHYREAYETLANWRQNTSHDRARKDVGEDEGKVRP